MPPVSDELSVIQVVGAAIVKDGKVLCAQRGLTKSLAGYWEFPGGKVEPGETAEQAVQREIHEELLCSIEVGYRVCTTQQTYDFGVVELTTYVCALSTGSPHLTEHQSIRWLPPSDLHELSWAPADREAVSYVAAMDFQRDKAEK